MFRKAPTQIFASHLSIAHTSGASIRKSYATVSHEECNVVGRWYDSFKAGKTLINKSHGHLMKTKIRTTFQYPLRDLLNQVPEALHLRLKQSTYLATSPGRRTICIPVNGKSSPVEKESFAWDALHTIIHEAVSYVTPGKKFMRQGSKTLNKKVNAMAKMMIEGREKQGKMATDKQKEERCRKAQQTEAAKNASRKRKRNKTNHIDPKN